MMVGVIIIIIVIVAFSLFHSGCCVKGYGIFVLPVLLLILACCLDVFSMTAVPMMGWW